MGSRRRGCGCGGILSHPLGDALRPPLLATGARMPSQVTTHSVGFLLNGRFVSRGPVEEVRSPFDGTGVAAVHLADAGDVEAAISAAVAAFQVTRKLSSVERQAVLKRIAEKLADRREEFARTMTLESGKPIRTARGEVDRSVFTFTIAAEEAT